MAAVSTIVNRGTPLKAYVFRNYNLLPGVRSHYLGGCQHQLWQAIRATSAAPGYFQEFTLGNDLHQVSPTRNSNRVAVVNPRIYLRNISCHCWLQKREVIGLMAVD